MDYAVNRAPLNHEMSTKSRGSILPAERGSLIGADPGSDDMPIGLESRNAFELPNDLYGAGGEDCDNRSDYPPEGL